MTALLALELRLNGGGYYGGRCLDCPPGLIRPAMARMRKSLFSIIGNNLNGAAFLDLFSGSGLMALEAASCGASYLTLVESDRGKQKVLHNNVRLLRRGEQVHIFIMPVERFLRRFDQLDYEVIYLDPPFIYPAKAELLLLLAAQPWLKDEGQLLIHHPKKENLPLEVAGKVGRLIQTQRRYYGGSCVSFYGWESS